MKLMEKTSAVNETQLYEFVVGLAGRVHIAKGVLETIRLIEKRRAKVVLIASNVFPRDRVGVVESLCEEKGVPIVFVSEKEALGKAVGLDVSASCIALPLAFPVEFNLGR
jgi:ribosomal protein L7Ae-like RNA K-turn-binding protein